MAFSFRLVISAKNTGALQIATSAIIVDKKVFSPFTGILLGSTELMLFVSSSLLSSGFHKRIHGGNC